MESHLSARAVALVALAVGALVVPGAPAQTLVWTARYDSGGPDQLGSGRPFRVDGSGAVTLAGMSGGNFVMVRYLADGSLGEARVQPPASPFGGFKAIIDSSSRSVWAGAPGAAAAGDEATLLMRFGFTGSPEILFSTVVGPLEIRFGTQIQESGDGGLFFGYHFSGHAGLESDSLWKVGGKYSGFLAGGNNSCGGWTLAAPDPTGGALIAVATSPDSLRRIDDSGAVRWSRSCLDSGWPWQKNPLLGVVDAAGNAWAAGRTAQEDDFLVTRLDPSSGAIVWQGTFDGAGHGFDSPTDLVIDAGRNVYVTGSSVGGTGNSDYLTLKYDAAGNLSWARTYDGGGEDRPAGVAVDSAGNVWVTGLSGNDVVTLKYDPAGNQVFSHRFVSPGPATVAGMALDSWGNATVAFSAAGDIFALRYGEAPVRVGPLSFFSLDPCRAFDSRAPALGGPDPLAGPSDHVLALVGVCGVPATAKAVTLNVTAAGATQPGNLVLFPAGRTVPLTSVINYAAGQTRANNATVGLGPNAGLGLHVSQGGGTVHVLVDIVGYWQ